ncbi:MAG: DUF1351 domain-containing protein [Clostridium sp.]
MKDIVLNKQLPVINMNFEEVRLSLIETMEKYKGIVVTEEGLKDCKATQRELSGLRKNIDTYRKQIKKEMEVPIKYFEGQCKELISLVDEVEIPIKEGIEVFNDKVRNEKLQYAENIISQSIKKYELEPRFSNQLTVLDSYTNLTATLKSIREDIENRVKSLKEQQDQAKAQAQILKATIIATVEGANATLNTKLKTEDYFKYIERGYNVAQVVGEINRAAELVRNTEKAEKERLIAEQRRKEEEKIRQEERKKAEEIAKVRAIEEQKLRSEAMHNEVKNEVIEPIKIQKNITSEMQEQTPIVAEFEISFIVKGEKEKVMELSRFLKENDFNYEVINQKRI